MDCALRWTDGHTSLVLAPTGRDPGAKDAPIGLEILLPGAPLTLPAPV